MDMGEPGRPRPPDLEAIFRHGARFRWSGLPPVSTQAVESAGKLHLPSGRLVACDPFWGSSIPSQVRPFEVRVEPGSYPVSVAITCKNPPGPSRQAAAVKLLIRDEPVMAWEPAQPEGYPAAVRRVYGFGVDSGTGCLVDMSALPALVDAAERRTTLSEGVNDMIRQCWINVPLDGGRNLLVFNCPLGDGLYPTWIGRTAAGQVGCFVTHLGLLNYSLGPIGAAP